MATASCSSLAAPGLIDRLAIFAQDIKLSHSIFAIPFGLLATFLAASHSGHLPGLTMLVLIVLCMFLARTTAMAANRWADARLDSLNPRTCGRAIPSGRLTGRFVFSCLLVFAVAFIVATAGFWVLHANVYPLVFSPLILAWLVAYSFTKRFTALCHLMLGSTLAITPLAASLAVEPGYLSALPPYLLAAMVLCWVAGFDVIYALQDVNSDRQTGVFSLPARVGVEPALWISRLLHALAIFALGSIWYVSPVLGTGFAIGIVLVTALLIFEHVLVWGSKTHQIHLAFLTVNGMISLVLGILGVMDIVRWVADVPVAVVR